MPCVGLGCSRRSSVRRATQGRPWLWVSKPVALARAFTVSTPSSRSDGPPSLLAVHVKTFFPMDHHHVPTRRAQPRIRAEVATPERSSDTSASPRAQSSSVLAVILGGGAGTRLYPLTKNRAKPAVPIGGAYRLIDVPMSNCINSGISKIYILTQFNSTSLNRHLARTYNMGTSGVRFGGDSFVEVRRAGVRGWGACSFMAAWQWWLLGNGGCPIDRPTDLARTPSTLLPYVHHLIDLHSPPTPLPPRSTPNSPASRRSWRPTRRPPQTPGSRAPPMRCGSTAGCLKT